MHSHPHELTPVVVPLYSPGLRCGSALFRHEIAYVLGQVAHPAATKQLEASLRDQQESDMVRMTH